MTGQLWYLAIPAAVTIVGGIVAAYWRPADRARSYLQHFAAGVVTAAVAVEVMPEIERENASPVWLLVGFGLGGLLGFGLKLLDQTLDSEDRNKRSSGWRASIGLTAAAGVDILVDGLTIGAGFSVGAKTGLLLALGLSTELAFLGLTVATELNSKGRATPILLTVVYAIALCGGALGGVLVLSQAPTAMLGAVLAFGAAAMLYLVLEELLVEAHARKRAPGPVLLLFLGFISFWALRLFS